MMKPEDLLQEQLEKLEAGVPLEDCLDDLDQDEAAALRLAASLREVPYAERDAEVVAAQRAAALAAASAGADETARRNGNFGTFASKLSGWTANALQSLQGRPVYAAALSRIRSWIDRLLTHRQLTLGLAGSLVLVLLVLAIAGLRGGQPNALEKSLDTALAPPDQGQVAMPVATQTAGPQVVAAEPGTEPGTEPDHEVYLPIFNSPLDLDPHKAALQDIRGIVEVQSEDGAWRRVKGAEAVLIGQSVRTGALSSATLAFFDGSQARLGQNTEISIVRLNARKPADGRRRVVLSQRVGESEHDVQSRTDDGSSYEVRTPAGSAMATGTSFDVLVTIDLRARFSVREGGVQVTNLSKTVSVVAGQLTTVIAGRAPTAPVFYLSGEGEVSQTGSVWIIAGLSFQTHNRTIIVGNPQVGDLVHVDGHLLPDGTRVADRITLLHREPGPFFSLAGEVESIGASAWTIAGQTIQINNETDIDEGIRVGDFVRVDGLILAGGVLLAEQITLFEGPSGLPFHFIGIVQEIGDMLWTISDRAVVVDPRTEIGADLEVGDLAEVHGVILEDGTWLARSIQPFEDEEREFSITGIVQSIDPWQVAGIPFEVREWTRIEPGIEVGDLVHVRGTILEDGTWVAATIRLVSDLPGSDTLTFFGIVQSIDPWVVSGIALPVTADTLILGEISVGSLVQVEIELLPDGTWRVLRIQALLDDFGLGCFVINTEVDLVSGRRIILNHLPPIDRDDDFDIPIDGDLDEGSIVIVHVCVLSDGTIIIITIIVIHEPIIIILPTPRPPFPNGNDNGNHNGNGNGNHNG